MNIYLFCMLCHDFSFQSFASYNILQMSLIICLEEQKVVGRHQIDYLALSAAILQVQYVTKWHFGIALLWLHVISWYNPFYRFCASKKGGMGEVGGFHREVPCTWELPWLAIEQLWRHWLDHFSPC